MNASDSKFQFHIDCSIARARDLENLYDHDREIGYVTFARKVDLDPVIRHMGYVKDKRHGLTLKDDYAVRYYRSKWRGQPCYHMVHSSVDLIFTVPSI